MKESKNTVIAVVVGIIVIGGVLIALTGGGNKKSSMNMGDTKSNSSSSAGSAVATDAVSIENYMFGPAAIKVKVGTKVTWTNKDSVHHSVVADTASSDAPNGPLIGQGESYSFTFNKAGTYTFHCGPHPYMHGTVVVTTN